MANQIVTSGGAAADCRNPQVDLRTFISSAGVVYVIAQEVNDPNSLYAWKAGADPLADPWENFISSYAAPGVNGIYSFGVVQVGDVLHTISTTGTSASSEEAYIYQSFDMATDTWSTHDRIPYSTNVPNDGGVQGVYLFHRPSKAGSADGEFVALVADAEKIMGTGYYRPAYITGASGSWSAPTVISGSPATDLYPGGLVPDSGLEDSCILQWVDETGNRQYRNLGPSNILTSATTDGTGITASHATLQPGDRASSGGEVNDVGAWVDANEDPCLVLNDTLVTLTGGGPVAERSGSTTIRRYAAAQASDDSTATYYLVWGKTSDDLYYATYTDADGFGTPVGLGLAGCVRVLSTIIDRGGSRVLALVYEVDTASNTIWYDEVALSGGGGAEEAVADGATAADVVAESADVSEALADGVTAADTPSDAASVNESLADGVTAADGVTSTGGASLSLADGATAADATAEQVDAGEQFADSTTSTDTVSERVSVEEALADGVTAADSLSADGSAEDIVSDGATAADTVIETVAAQESLSDGVTASDSVTEQSTGGIDEAVADGTTAADTLSEEVAAQEALSDAVTPADTLSDTAQAQEGLSDGLAGSDVLAEQVDAENLLSDDTTASDVVTESVQGETSESVSDGATLSDSTSSRADVAEAVGDSGTLGDTLTAHYEEGVSDGATLSDSVASVRGVEESVADGNTAGDVVSNSAAVLESLSEAGAQVDALFNTTSVEEAVSEAASLLDTIGSASRGISELLSDSATGLDTLSEVVNSVESLLDSVVAADLLTGTSSLFENVSESGTLWDRGEVIGVVLTYIRRELELLLDLSFSLQLEDRVSRDLELIASLQKTLQLEMEVAREMDLETTVERHLEVSDV